MLDELRDRMSVYLMRHTRATLCFVGDGQVWLLPVDYRSVGLNVYCVIPTWSDVTYYLQTPAAVQLLVAGNDARQEWLTYAGTGMAMTAASCATSTDLYGEFPQADHVLIRLEPCRLDLFDDALGWGARATLEL